MKYDEFLVSVYCVRFLVLKEALGGLTDMSMQGQQVLGSCDIPFFKKNYLF